MDDNQNNKTTTYEVVNFSTKEKNKTSFSKSVLVPFFSGVLGTTLVIGTCFGIPQIREKFIGNASTTVSTGTSRNKYQHNFTAH